MRISGACTAACSPLSGITLRSCDRSRAVLARAGGGRTVRRTVPVGPPGGVKTAFDGARERHPSGERLTVPAIVVHDAGDGVRLKIEVDCQAGMVR